MTTINVGLLKSNIENLVNQRGESKTKVFINSGVGKDFFSNLNKGQIPSVEKIISLANYLNVSVDYLLGRTESQNGYSNNNNGNNSIQTIGEGKNINSTIGTCIDGMEKEMIDEFKKLKFEDKVKVINLIAELNKKGA